MAGLEKGLSVLLAFDRNESRLTLSEIARKTDLNPATVRRCLLTLERLGLVGRSKRQFMLRPKVLDFGAAYLDSMNFEDIALDELKGFAENTHDSASMCLLDGHDIVYVAHASYRTLIRIEAHAGSRFPAFATSMGRVLLAGLDSAALDAYFASAEFPALTDATVTSRKALRAEINAVRERGYSVVEDELAYGVIALAVAVHDRQGNIVAAVNSSGHSKETTRQAMVEQRLEGLRRVADEIEANLKRQNLFWSP